jgi:Protein of unknown function (DUF3606)
MMARKDKVRRCSILSCRLIIGSSENRPAPSDRLIFVSGMKRPESMKLRSSRESGTELQVAYWKERFGVSEEELGEAVRAAGALARQVEAYLKSKNVR